LQEGELVLRTVEDAVALRARLSAASSVVVIGAGFLGLEVATAAAGAGASVCVVDPDPPLQRLLGEHLAGLLVERAVWAGITFHRGPAALVGEPVGGVRLADGSVIEADAVVSCVGDVPASGWLDGTALASPHGIEIDGEARTVLPGVYAAGDVAAVRRNGVLSRGPFWANAVAQGRVAAAGVLGHRPAHGVVDHYFWTDLAGVQVKAVGALPLRGRPTVLEDGGDGTGLLAWEGQAVVALGIKRSVPRLRKDAQQLGIVTP
ncbi:MAG: ferredoxin reductase, partial [Actinomycetales bacterium]